MMLTSHASMMPLLGYAKKRVFILILMVGQESILNIKKYSSRSCRRMRMAVCFFLLIF
ncbi:hypothetical protein EMIT047CA2_30191 [Pseudomonas soli]